MSAGSTFAAVVLLTIPPAWGQDVSNLNQDIDDRPNLQSEQTIGGHTLTPGVKVQQPQAASPGATRFKRRPARASKAPPDRFSAASAKHAASATEPPGSGPSARP